MSKKQRHVYATGERKAEKEIDRYLRGVNAPAATDIMKDLRQLSGLSK